MVWLQAIPARAPPPPQLLGPSQIAAWKRAAQVHKQQPEACPDTIGNKKPAQTPAIQVLSPQPKALPDNSYAGGQDLVRGIPRYHPKCAQAPARTLPRQQGNKGIQKATRNWCSGEQQRKGHSVAC
ncbi:hypothetical protein H920_19978 [Fukomys damarensis]|uniref:Uncharacterized protein n=1 Tax=Fukomys damarensis TaxID=885580 RepID=A0A091CLF9_FUKDA|nr:hypothetical protein H920_19978 [Fukomys damarensis]